MILWIIGLLGFGMRVLDVPVAPCVVGLILGPLAEQQFRRALAISQGDPTVFFTHPISLALLIIAVLLVLVPHVPPSPAAARRPAGRDPGRIGLTRGGAALRPLLPPMNERSLTRCSTCSPTPRCG